MSFNFMAAVTVCSDSGAKENKICHHFHFFPIYLSGSDRTRYHDLSFLNVEFQGSFFTLLFSPSSRGSLVPLCFLPLEWYLGPIWFESLYAIGFPVDVVIKNLPANAGDTRDVGLIPGLGTHFSILAWENTMERADWQATVHGVAKSRSRLSD